MATFTYSTGTGEAACRNKGAIPQRHAHSLSTGMKAGLSPLAMDVTTAVEAGVTTLLGKSNVCAPLNLRGPLFELVRLPSVL